MMFPKRYHNVGRIVAILLLVLLLGVVTVLAQDEGPGGLTPAGGENFNSPAIDIDQTPVGVSRTESPGATEVVVEIPVNQDTYITSNQPDRNWCGSNFLRLGYNMTTGENYGAERIFLRADLSSIPSDAAIHNAVFRIYMHTATPPGDSDMRIESRHLNSGWDQCAVTWNSHQPNWGAVFGSSWVGTNTGWLQADATQLVQDWVYGTHPNHGAMLMGDEHVRERQRMFYSTRDAGGRYPRLIVHYTVHHDKEPPVVSVNPLPQWSPHRFTVSWSGHDPGGSGIAYYDVQYKTHNTGWIDWLQRTTETSNEWVAGVSGTTYEYRARGVDNAGNVQQWSSTAQASTTVDSIAPSATVNPLPPSTFSSAFTVSWTGSDNPGGSGIKNYDVQFQENGGPWKDWLKGTTTTSAQFTGAQNGVTYGLRARATDNVGNVQPWSHTDQAWTKVNTQGPEAWILSFEPSITDQGQFMVRWSGNSSPDTPISHYDVRYRYGLGGWMAWQSQTQLAEALFTNVQPDDGTYCFEASATDSIGRSSGYMGRQCIIVDRHPPHMQPQSYLPQTFNSYVPNRR